jgi:hypothetical protein
MKPMVQPGSALASTAHDFGETGKLLRGRITRPRRCVSVERLESRCLLSTVTEFPPLTSGFASEISPAAGKLWFTVQNPSAIGMIDPSDPTRPHFFGSNIGGKPVGMTTGPDGNVWFTEPTNLHVAADPQFERFETPGLRDHDRTRRQRLVHGQQRRERTQRSRRGLSCHAYCDPRDFGTAGRRQGR